MRIMLKHCSSPCLRKFKCERRTSALYWFVSLVKSSLVILHSCFPSMVNLDTCTSVRVYSLTAHCTHCCTWSTVHMLGSGTKIRIKLINNKNNKHPLLLQYIDIKTYNSTFMFLFSWNWSWFLLFFCSMLCLCHVCERWFSCQANWPFEQRLNSCVFVYFDVRM